MPLSKETLQFLAENKLHNSREWFSSHKAVFQEIVLAPLIELVKQLEPAMLAIDEKLITEAKTDRCISRIYRDTRFSKDKSLYRDVMWCAFSRDKKIFPSAPSFVLEISPYGFRYGCGYYSAPTKVMETICMLILNSSPKYLEAQGAYESQHIFEMQGEKYKRAHFPEQSESKRLWLERRNIAFMHDSKNTELLFEEDFAKQVAKDFTAIVPIYSFLCMAGEGLK